MSASDNLSTKCSGLLLRSSFAILAARARHLFSVAPMPAFSVASRPSNSSDIMRSGFRHHALRLLRAVPRPVGRLAARARHLFSVAPMPAFSVASRPSNSSDIMRSGFRHHALRLLRAVPRPVGRLLSAPGSKWCRHHVLPRDHLSSFGIDVLLFQPVACLAINPIETHVVAQGRGRIERTAAGLATAFPGTDENATPRPLNGRRALWPRYA